MKKMTKRVLGILLAAGMLLSSTACNSPGGSTAGGKEEKFPSKQVTIIMPWSLGGGPDTIARQVASYGEKYLGVPVIVENKTGGAGNDSYTMISVLFKLLDIPAEAIPYDGGQDAINALAGGHVDVAIGSPPVYRDYVVSGELNCLGTFIPEGIDVEGIGHIPSFKEQGIDVEFTGMDYFAVRSSVDDSKKAVLTKFIQDVYADPDFQKFMSEMGMEAWGATEDEILTMIEDQTTAMKDYIPLIQ